MSWAPEYAYWLASYPKSGNTWVRMLLSAYKTGVLDINAGYVATVYDGDEYLYNSLSPYSLHEMRMETVLFLRPAVLLHLLVATKTKPTIIKTHNANVILEGITLIPRPLTKAAVYLVRDPRDVAVSFAKHTGDSIDETISLMGNQQGAIVSKPAPIPTQLTTWSNHVETWERDFVTRIRYEDFVEDAVTAFTTVLNALDIKVNKPRVKKAVRLCELDNLKKQEVKTGFIEMGKQDKFFGQGKGWRNELTEAQVRQIEQDHGEVMEKLGYKLEYL